MTQETEPLRRKLAGTRRWWRATRFLGATAWLFAALAALALVCYHADRVWILSASARETWRLVAGAGGLAGLAIAAAWIGLRALPDSLLAAQVERRYPVLRERLLTTIDLTPAYAASAPGVGGGSPGFSRSLAGSLIEETRQAAANLDFRRAVGFGPLRSALLIAALTVLAAGADYVAAPGAFRVWLERMANPRADIAPFALTRVWLTPDANLLPRGAGVGVTVTTRGGAPDRCTLRYRLDSDRAGEWKTATLTNPTPVRAGDKTAPGAARTNGVDGANEKDGEARRFRYRFPALAQSLTLAASANDGRSNERRVLVEDRPTLLNARLTLHFPAYLHRPDQLLPESTGAIAAPVGTNVDVAAKANKPLQSANLRLDNRQAGAWRVQGDQTFGRLAVWKDGSYGLDLTDTHGFNNPAAPRYEIHALPDQPPTVQINRPATDMDLVPDGSLPLVAHASDDYGVARMTLNYDKLRGASGYQARGGSSDPDGKSVAQGALALPGPNGAPQADAAVRWSIASAGAKLGDTLRYEVRAFDSDTLHGPHVAHSAAYRIRVVSLLEMQRRLKEQLDEESRALTGLRQRQTEAQKLVRSAQAKFDRATVNRAQEMQRSLAQEAQSTAQRIAQTTAQLENNNLATNSERARREQAAQSLQALAQQKMPQAADTIAKAQTPKAASNLAQAARAQAEIQRALAQAQQTVARGQSVEQLAEEAKRLALEQARLAGQTAAIARDLKTRSPGQPPTPEQRDSLELARRQQAQTGEATRRLQQQLAQSAQAMQERGQSEVAKAMRQAAQALQQAQVGARQKQAQNSLQRGEPQNAASPQSQAAQALQKAADALAKASGQTAPEAPPTAAERLEQAAEKLRELAQRQRDASEQIAKNPDAQARQKLAQQERGLQEAAGKAQANLRDAPGAQQNAQAAQKSLSQAGQQLDKNSPQSAKQPAQNAAQQLEKAAQQAANAAQQLRQQQIAAEMQARVERLARVERGLQSVTARLDAARKKGALDSNAENELRQLGLRQELNEREARNLAQRFPSLAFQQALRMASRQMKPATENLRRDQPVTDAETQRAQDRAARSLETIASALKQQNESASQAQSASQNKPEGATSPQQAQAAAALGELMLARGLQQQLRQDTGALDTARMRNKDHALDPAQEREAASLADGEQEARGIAESAADALEELPEAAQAIRNATGQMEQAQQKLSRKETGQPPQSNQDEALKQLGQAASQVQQAMQRQQQQQQQQMQQQASQGAPQPNAGKGNTPGRKPIVRLEARQPGLLATPDTRSGKGFASLSPRAQRTLHEGQQEHVPAEFQDLVSRYYKSLAEKKR